MLAGMVRRLFTGLLAAVEAELRGVLVEFILNEGSKRANKETLNQSIVMADKQDHGLTDFRSL